MEDPFLCKPSRIERDRRRRKVENWRTNHSFFLLFFSSFFPSFFFPVGGKMFALEKKN